MEIKKYLMPLALVVGGLIVASGCVTTTEGDEVTLESLEEMSELEYARMSQYTYLGTKIGAARLLEGGQIDAETLDAVADVLEGITTTPVLDFASGFITDLISEQIDLTSDELMLLLIIVEQELLTRGGATYIDEETGEVRLTERAEELLLLVANALRTAVDGVTLDEEAQHDALEKSYAVTQ